MDSKGEENDKNKEGEEKPNTEEVALQDVRDALIKLREALPKLTKFLGGSITDLVGKLQNCLPEQPARSHANRRHQRRYHTVGVTPEEVAQAKEWIKQKNCQRHELIHMKFEPLDYKAGWFMEPAPQVGVLSYISSPEFDEDEQKMAQELAAHLTQKTQNKIDLPNEINLEPHPKNDIVNQLSSSDEETLTPSKHSNSSQRSAHIKRKLKRSNTLEVPRHNHRDDSQDELTYNSDHSECRHTPNYLTNKTDDDSNKSDDVQKYLSSSSQEDPQGKVITYNPSARGGKHWSNRFSRIKTAFEELSSDEKEMVSPNQKVIPEKKLPWIDNQKQVPTVYNHNVSPPTPSNQFTHAPLSRFKPVEKKSTTAFFPSSVSGTVKQLVNQKFSQAKSEPELNIEKPMSFTQRTLAKFRPKKQKQPVVQVTPVVDKNKFYSYNALTQPKPEQHLKNDLQNYIPQNYSIAYSDRERNGGNRVNDNRIQQQYPPNNYTFNFDYDGVQARFQGIPNHKEKTNQTNNTLINPYYRPDRVKGPIYNSSYSSMTQDNEYNNSYLPVNKENLPYQLNIPAENVFYNNTSTNMRHQESGESPSYRRNYYDSEVPDHHRNFLQKSPSAHDYFFPSRREEKVGDSSEDIQFIDKLAVGRIMGEAQKRNVAVINPLVRSLSGLLPPKKPTSGHSLSKSPNTLKKSEKFLNAPNQPKILHKSESCHQLVAQYLPPVNSSVKGAPRPPTVRRNSDHSTRDGTEKNPSNVHVKHVVLQTSCDVLPDNPLTGEEIENVDEVFESIFKEANLTTNIK